MTAVVILNIVFAAFVLGGMLVLLGRAIIADQRATGTRSSRRPRAARWSRQLQPAV